MNGRKGKGMKDKIRELDRRERRGKGKEGKGKEIR